MPTSYFTSLGDHLLYALLAAPPLGAATRVSDLYAILEMGAIIPLLSNELTPQLELQHVDIKTQDWLAFELVTLLRSAIDSPFRRASELTLQCL